MSAGSGIVHSEFNGSDNETELLQIWLFPDKRDIEPGYDEKVFEEQDNTLQLLVSQQGEDESLNINRDVKLYRSFLNKDKEIVFQPEKKFQWLQLISGSINVNGIELNSGDGLGLDAEEKLFISSQQKAHFLLFDMN